MRPSALKIQLLILTAVFTGCAGSHPGPLREASVCDGWFSCKKVIEESRDTARVQQAKAKLEQIATETRDPNALFAFISAVPESPRRPEAVERYKQILHDVVLRFAGGQQDRIKHADKVLGCRSFAPGAKVTLNGNFTRTQVGCDIYSWPLAPLQVQGQPDGLIMISGQGVILNPSDGNAYVRGSDLF